MEVHSCSPSAQQAEQKDYEFQDSLSCEDKPCQGLGEEGSVVQLVECLPHTHKTLGLVFQPYTDRQWYHTSVIPALRKWKQED